MTLPSNSSLLYFPHNRVTSYKVKLAETLHFYNHQFECDLAAISYPRTWYNIRKDQNVRMYVKLNNSDIFQTVLLPVGYYDTVEKLISMTK